MSEISENSCVVGMSGGVDSTAAAHSMLMRGFDVRGVTLRFFSKMGPSATRRDDKTVEKAGRVCQELGIPHDVIDASDEFRSRVVEYFIDSYRKGRTPNPCIVCNEHIKFPMLAAAADSAGAKFIVTGHYARIVRSGGVPFLASAEFKEKDQSYFLYRVSPEYLERTIFPNGASKKDEIRQIVSGILPEHDIGEESQDICFIPDNDLETFLSSHLDPIRGDVLDSSGRKIGEHRGVCFYTIGQRRGLGIASACPLYVKEIDPDEDRIILASDSEMYSSKAVCGSLKMRKGKLSSAINAKIRFRHRPAPVLEARLSGERLSVKFKTPQRAVTPGQSLVLYEGDIVAGGGEIERSS